MNETLTRHLIFFVYVRAGLVTAETIAAQIERAETAWRVRFSPMERKSAWAAVKRELQARKDAGTLPFA